MVTIIKNIKSFKKSSKNKKPIAISCKTTIGFGSPNKAGKASSHGSPLGEEEIKLVRKNSNGIMNHLRYQIIYLSSGEKLEKMLLKKQKIMKKNIIKKISQNLQT